jgi:hypothetical protein
MADDTQTPAAAPTPVVTQAEGASTGAQPNADSGPNAIAAANRAAAELAHQQQLNGAKISSPTPETQQQRMS